ncbi:hypothetical protein [Acetobacterium sp.]|uniref:hypothetical protein n=1 Tax=Acetobacterium sp. TaxID=1872094 RepID=UPI00272819D6|nr:hypothetical protein [Acetobacterium sp.]MDO9493809.1 hypothetical protein [Acetobacterium sp.]
MYRYQIRLYPELLKNREGLKLDPTLDLVKEIAKDYTIAGMKAANKKGIEEDTIEIKNGNTLQFILVSEAWLKFPTKAIRNFISKLSKIEPYNGLITPNGRLFKGESEFLGEDILDIVDEKLKLTDERALIEIIRLFFRETEGNRKTINMLKEIVGGVN